MPLDDELDKLLKEENATTEAVKSLIGDKDKIDKDRDIEIKTDLDSDNINVHSTLEVINNMLEDSFKSKGSGWKCILGRVIAKKERKLLSLNRKSRAEIVEVAKHPDISTQNISTQDQNFLKRMITPRR